MRFILILLIIVLASDNRPTTSVPDLSGPLDQLLCPGGYLDREGHVYWLPPRDWQPLQKV